MPEPIPPTFASDGFDCPRCGAFAHQVWGPMFANRGGGGLKNVEEWTASYCTRCKRSALWDRESLVYPEASGAPPPHPEMPEAVRFDYEEAADIAARSPRGAAGLLRLAIQKLVNELEPDKNLNDGIGKLVERGLDPTVQQALDIVRVVGNNALHPGEMDVNDSPQTAMALFGLTNEITEAMIARPRRVAALYGTLPEGAREAVVKRDAKGK